MNEIADLAELLSDFFGNRLLMRRVRKCPMELGAIPRENRTGLLGIITNSYDIVKMLPQQLADALRTLAGYINTKFAHDLNGYFVDCGRLGSSTENLEFICSIMPQYPFSHLRTAGISST